MEKTKRSREELAEKLYQWMFAQGNFDVLGASLHGYELPDWIDYPAVDVVARNRSKENRLTLALALTTAEVQPRRTGISPLSQKELAPIASEWIVPLANTLLTYPPDQIGKYPDIILAVERQDEEDLLKLLHDLGLRLEIGRRIFVEVLD